MSGNATGNRAAEAAGRTAGAVVEGSIPEASRSTSHHATRNSAAIPKATLIEHALYGLGFEVRQMRDTPLDKLDVAAALKRIEDECVRIAKGEVSDLDIIG